MARILGLDLGSYSVKGILFESNLRGYSTKAYAEVRRAEGDRTETLRAAVQQLLPQLPMQADQVIVALPGPDEDHNPETGAKLADVLRANPEVPYDKRIEVARFLEDLSAGYQGGWYSLISLHGGGSPAAMKQEIWRHYPVGSKVELVERLLERGVLHDPQRAITRNRQPGKCCDMGCSAPGQPVMVDLPARRPARDGGDSGP